MTIRRRLALAFVAVLALFALTQAFQLWSARLRADAMVALSRALKRQLVISSFQHRVDNLQKQVSLLSQTEGGGDPAEAGQAFDQDLARAFDEELTHAADDLQTLRTYSDPSGLPQVEQLATTYAQLASAWRQFYSYLGQERSWAVAFQLRSEPLGRRVLLNELPALVREQNAMAIAAEADFTRTTELTARVSVVTFVASMLFATLIAYLLGRSLTRALQDLQLGATRIGTMDLDHRIAVRSGDEIGLVARAFNDMAENLAAARRDLTQAHEQLVVKNVENERQRQVSESLLTNILPEQVAAELAAEGRVAPRYFEEVTILFTDFVGFTLATEQVPAEDLVERLHAYFTAFDHIVTRYGLEKLKTIGDSYMCAGGLPVRTPSHPVDAVLAAFEMIEATADQGRLRPDIAWGVRVGLHTGPVAAGVVGIKKFAFDVWGDTVNFASRMEATAEPNRINVSAAASRRLKDFFVLEYRGRVTTKDKQDQEMYFVNGVLPPLLGEADEHGVPLAFQRRYRTYFQKDLGAFPGSLRTQIR